MLGIFRLAYKLLVNDKAKFTALLIGITFAVFGMMFATSMFIGVLTHASATITNIGAKIWVMDPSVQTVANSIPMPDYILDAVRSMQGVKYAVPLYSGGALVKLPDGTYQSVTVIGLDDTSLFGRPDIIQGRIEDIYAENAFFAVQDAEFPKLGNPKVGSCDQAVAKYRQTVLSAFQEVEDNLSSVRLLPAEIESQDAAVRAAARALEEANARYTAGLDSYLNVLSAQTVLLSAQQVSINLQVQQITATVQLIKALGGGWNVTELPSPKSMGSD